MSKKNNKKDVNKIKEKLCCETKNNIVLTSEDIME